LVAGTEQLPLPQPSPEASLVCGPQQVVAFTAWPSGGAK
jgi:hypothetical protein